MLKHNELTNTKVSTIFGDIHFDQEGISNDLDIMEQMKIGKLHGFEYIPTTTQLAEDVKEEVTVADSVDEEVTDTTVEAYVYDDMTASEIKAELDAKGIEHKANASKKDLFALLTK